MSEITRDEQKASSQNSEILPVCRGYLIRDVTRRFPPFCETDGLFSCLWFCSRDVCIVLPVIYSIVRQFKTSPRLVSFVFHFISYSILVHGLKRLSDNTSVSFVSRGVYS